MINVYNVAIIKLKGRDHMEGQDVNVKIILKWISSK
jgi:hypothetical protein